MERPELEEFLSALNGFLDKPTTANDPSYHRFLEIFCRSVGASEGHLLTAPGGVLNSVFSIGLGDKFDQEFNAGVGSGGANPSPLDSALRTKRVSAIVEFSPKAPLPPWFMEIMDRHSFRSLLAVPLLSQTEAVGVLCAYYHDACLFDQGTLERMMVIGRMVGSAMEKSLGGPAAPARENQDGVDEFLSYLAAKTFTKIHVFAQLARIAGPALHLSGAICGPIRKAHDEHAITVIGAHNVPGSAISNRLLLPSFLEKKIITGQWPSSKKEWGHLTPLLSGPVSSVVCQTLAWHNRMFGAFIGWRTGGDISTEQEGQLSRLAGIASLALSASQG